MVGVSLGVGPTVGGLLIESVGWRAIFWINIPIGVAAFVLTSAFVPESRAEHPRRPDLVGQVAVLVLLASLTYAIIESPRRGWASVSTLGTLALAVVALVVLVGYERRRFQPLLDLRFFRSVPFTGATVMAVCAFGAFAGFLFLNTLYLQDVRHLSALRAGLCLLPFAVTTVVAAPLSGRLVGTRGPRIPLLFAGLFIAVGGLLLVGVQPHTPLWRVLAAYVVFSVGFGLVNAPITNAAVSGMPNNQAGVAAAVASTSRQVGAALGVAIVGSVLNSGLHGRIGGAGFGAAARPGWWIVAGAGVVVLAIGLLSSSRRAEQSAARTAELFADERGAPAQDAEKVRA